MTTLYLVRHGETVDNARKLMQGHTPGRLNERGVSQAHELGRLLSATPFDAFIASDLKRAVDTATILAEPRGLPVVTTPLLRERDWGSFTGRFIPDLENAVWPDDIEPLETMLGRAAEFLAWVRGEFPGKQVLAVGHGIINKAIQSVHYGKQMREVERMSNCEFRILRLS